MQEPEIANWQNIYSQLANCMKQYFMTSNRKVVKHTFACKSIGAQVFSVVRFLLVLIEIKVNHLCVTVLLDTYSLQVNPVKHAGWQQAFRSEYILFHFGLTFTL